MYKYEYLNPKIAKTQIPRPKSRNSWARGSIVSQQSHCLFNWEGSIGIVVSFVFDGLVLLYYCKLETMGAQHLSNQNPSFMQLLPGSVFVVTTIRSKRNQIRTRAYNNEGHAIIIQWEPISQKKYDPL